MIEIELNKIIIDEKRQDQIIVLKEKGGERHFPIVIGFLEASSIKMNVSGINPPRPMTHDLLLLMLESLDAELECLIIDKMVDNTFHAKLKIRTKDGNETIVDSRPSDGVALAVRAGAPIYALEEVIEKAVIFKAK
ncbi:MAG: bifunctional nuclease family protein [Candidatus Zapsychrus exili]|nr:bifunctional nuclease family protein [Candidatus Zapsychrus exili]